MSLNDLYTVTVQYAERGKEHSCVFGYRMSAGSDNDELPSILAGSYAVATKDEWRALFTQDVILQCVIVRNILANDEMPGYHYFDSGDNGLNSGDALPGVSPALFKFLTNAQEGRKHGRKYVSCLPEGQLNDGKFNQGFVDGAMTDWSTAHEADITAQPPDDQTFEPVVINRMENSLPLLPPTGSAVTQIIPLPTIYKQLRRKTPRTAYRQ